MAQFEGPNTLNAMTLAEYNDSYIKGDIADRYKIYRSCRFNSASAQYLYKTNQFASNRKTFTISFWAKRTIANTGTASYVINGSSSQAGGIGFTGPSYGVGTADHLIVAFNGAVDVNLITTRSLRDPSAWFHVVVAVDTTQLVPSERVKLYINGILETSFHTATYPSRYIDLNWNNADTVSIGRVNGSTYYYDGYLAEIINVDGMQLPPTAFGKFSSITDEWIPTKPNIPSFGPNGFYINFGDNLPYPTTPDSYGLFVDRSGSSVGFAPTGFTLDPTSASFCITNDSPTNNLSVLNVNRSATTLGNGNLSFQATAGSGDQKITTATHYIDLADPVGFYWEIIGNGSSTGCGYGLVRDTVNFTTLNSTGFSTTVGTMSLVLSTGEFYLNNSIQATYGAIGVNDIVSFRTQSGNLWIAVNGIDLNSGNPVATGLTGNWAPAAAAITTSNAINCIFNFGQIPFKYKSLNTFQNLATQNYSQPTITKPRYYFDAVAYSAGTPQIGIPTKRTAASRSPTFSCRLREDVPQYATMTPSVTGNTQRFTTSLWYKRSFGDRLDCLFIGNNAQLTGFYIGANGVAGGNQLVVYFNGSPVKISNRLFKDCTRFYHIVVAIDTTQATASNRIRVYVDNEEITSWATDSPPAQNTSTNAINVSGIPMGLGGNPYGIYNAGFISEFVHIDGQQLTPASFGELNVDNIWVPKSVTGLTYGTNGSYLNFSNVTSATTFFNDASGNAKHYTPVNITLTAGITYEPSRDVPADSSETIAGYPILNFYDKTNSAATDGLRIGYAGHAFSGGSGSYSGVVTRAKSTINIRNGKFYWEIYISDLQGMTLAAGITLSDIIVPAGSGSHLVSNTYGISSGSVGSNGSTNTHGTSFSNGDYINVAVDFDNGYMWFGKNGTWILAGDPSIGTNPLVKFPAKTNYSPYVEAYTSGGSVSTGHINFGQRAFNYTPPTGFNRVNTFNIQNNTNRLLEQPADFIWLKSRSSTTSHVQVDTLRGLNNYLSSDTSTAQTTNVNIINGNNKFGIMPGSDSSSIGTNVPGNNYMSYSWKESAIAGFDIVTYTGDGVAGRTVAHSLGAVPEMIIVKPLNGTTANGWRVYHSVLGNANYLQLNQTAGSTAYSDWNSQTPTSSVFYVNGSPAGTTNENGTNYVAYLWRSVPGFSRIGSYVGNGSADGPFVHLGFRPKFLMFKNSSAGIDNWVSMDTIRSPFNYVQTIFCPNSNIGDATAPQYAIDFVANGFKVRTNTNTGINTSSHVYVYIAFADQPFKYSNAR